MIPSIQQFTVMLCGPSDVQTEIEIARDVIENWNKQHQQALKVNVKSEHWRTDAYPSASGRGQGVINKQLVDKADILVCIFWSRFGAPTGRADSGTQEEIFRGIEAGKHVALYFSQAAPPADAKPSQVKKVEKFRKEMSSKSFYGTFRTHEEFKDLFANHISKIIHDLRSKYPEAETKSVSSSGLQQTITGGKSNVQIGGNVETYNHYASPPIIKTTIERPPGSISPAQGKKIQKAVEALVNATVNKSQSEAFGYWWKKLKDQFDVSKVELISQVQYPLVLSWCTQQKAILTSKLKRKAPDTYRNARISAIKAGMNALAKTNENYYPEIAKRLKIHELKSLTELTKVNLDRVYTMVSSDQRSKR